MFFIALWLLLSSLAFASDCNRPSTGFTPFTEPYPRPYQGFTLGLYPNASNLLPTAHLAAGLRLAAEVRPRNFSGALDDATGRIVLLSAGMSNATQEFSTFLPLANADREKNPRLLIVDGAQGGWSADRLVAGGDVYWATVATRLAAAGASAAQVQVVWMKQADASPTKPFPEDARQLQSELATLARTLRARFPNLRLLYLSNRIYAGYATTNLNPEPYAYQSGFAVKWLIEQQIQGDASLSYDAGLAPWMAWGPYLWADGTRSRGDGLVWNCEDLQASDGTHPSPSGARKVAAMLLDFFKSDPTARPWFVRAATPSAPSIGAVVNGATYLPSVATGSIASLFGTELADGTAAAASLPLPHTLAGTQVLVGGEQALLFYVSPVQINFQIPAAPAGTDLTVVRSGVASKAFPATLSLYAPGLFTLDSTPSGPAAALHADGSRITAQSPARTGEIIMLFGTGLGVRNPLIMAPEVLPVVRIGGIEATLTYYGPAPGYPGLNQFNVTIPNAAPSGAVPVVLQLASSVSNQVTLNIVTR